MDAFAQLLSQTRYEAADPATLEEVKASRCLIEAHCVLAAAAAERSSTAHPLPLRLAARR